MIRLPHPSQSSGPTRNCRSAAVAIGLVAAATTAVAAAVATRGRLTMRKAVVTGDSMLPALRPGDRVVVLGPWPIRPGQPVAVTDPRQRDRLMVKRVRTVEGGQVEVRGDHPERSTDSRHFGPVPRDHVVGRVLYRYWPPERSGWVRKQAGDQGAGD